MTRLMNLIIVATVVFLSCCICPAVAAEVTLEQAQQFIERAENELAKRAELRFRALWIQDNYITGDTQIMAAKASEEFTAATVRLANEANQYSGLPLSEDNRRKLTLMKLALHLPAPSNPEKIAEISQIAAELTGLYGKAEYCPAGKKCLAEGDMTKIIAHSRDPEELQDIWQGWRQVSPPMREKYERLIELVNQGAVEFGYADLGAYWRSKYDMPADDFAVELDRIYNQVKPLYDALHCHVRAMLGEFYGHDVVPQDEAIPAHLLGNMWAQDWVNIYDLVAPEDADPGYDLTENIVSSGMTEVEMVEMAERFFVSLGFDPLPATFYERSTFVKPRDRDMVCHASAEDIDGEDDLRIKMCIERNAEDFSVIHHELGHNFYMRAYKGQSHLYRESANGGFHEAIGDTIALSITPGYLMKVGLLETMPDESKDIGLLMNKALDKVAFLPWGLLVDQWRWQVSSGEISPKDYNQKWWELRENYQGVRAPAPRDESHFDPGAKYHVPGNVSYTRYFVADVMQFQFHRALCEIAGFEGPLNRCSIYGSKEAGAALDEMLTMGMSKPWPEALSALSGETQMDASAMLDYFAPLKSWLDEQNKDRTCGW